MKQPTPTQMKALQHLRGGRLVIRATGHDFLNDISIESVVSSQLSVGYLFAERTAKILIENRWVELKGFSARKGEYRLTATGRALTTREFCRCPKAGPEKSVLLSGIDPEASTPNRDWPKERLLCRRCWRRVACAVAETRASARVQSTLLAKAAPSLTVGFPPLHGANRWHWKLGPICQRHFLKPEARG